MSDAVKATWTAITARIKARPETEVVPEAAMDYIDAVVTQSSDIAFERWPTNSEEDRAHRAHFWKLCVLQSLRTDGRATEAGVFAVYLHELIAATIRGDAATGMDDDFTVDIPNYGGHARAAHDAYMACTASLD
jgi:hypothetical protein